VKKIQEFIFKSLSYTHSHVMNEQRAKRLIFNWPLNELFIWIIARNRYLIALDARETFFVTN